MADNQPLRTENGFENYFPGLANKGKHAFTSAKSTTKSVYEFLKTSVDNFKKTNANYNNFLLVKSSKDLKPGSKIMLSTCIVIKSGKDLYQHANVLDGTYYVVKSAKELNPDSKAIGSTYKVVKNVKDFYGWAKMPYKLFLSLFFSWTHALSHGLSLVKGNVFESFDKFVENKISEIQPEEITETSS